MEQKDLIKYAAIAAGAYIVYRWYMAQQTPQVTGGQQAPLPGQTTQPAQQPPPPPPSQPATGVPGMATEADFIRWATDPAAAASAPRDKVLTLDEWNFYRGEKGGRPIVDALLMGVDSSNRSTFKVSAQEYWVRMQQAGGGMSGMGGFYFSGTGFVTDYGWLM